MVGQLRASRALAWMALGEPSRGMRELHALLAERISTFYISFLSFTMGVAYARIARGEGSASLLFLVRNLGFVLRHALPARRKARALLEAIADSPPDGLGGNSGAANLELARLHAHKGEREAARSRAAQAIEIFERQGAVRAVAQAHELLSSLEQR
jgi:hypothetical protein